MQISVTSLFRLLMSSRKKNRDFSITEELQRKCPKICDDIRNYVSSHDTSDKLVTSEKLVWRFSIDGSVSCKQLYEHELDNASTWSRLVQVHPS